MIRYIFTGCFVHPDFKHGDNFNIGRFAVIEADVKVGDNVSLGHHVLLKSGTRFGDDVKFADYCRTTGISYLGNNVNVRTAATISKSVIVEDCAFIGPGVMTNHTKHVVHMRPNLDNQQLITRIGYGAVIGSETAILAGVTVGDNVVIGARSLVTRDVLKPGIHVGQPVKKVKNLPESFILERPKGYQSHRFSRIMLKKYLPYSIDPRTIS